jgi:large subunit ribosomal protein L15
MNLSQLHPPAGSRHRRKRVGRGPGSGLGKTSGRGEKGQKSRSGYSGKRGFEGGQMPLIRRVPKRGFHNLFRKEFAIVNVGRLEKVTGDEVSPQGLLKSGVISTLHNGLKILGDGELTRALNVSAHRVSKSARQKIEAAGGKIELLTVLEPVRRKAVPEPPDAEGAATPKASTAKAPKPKAAKAKPAARPAAKAKPAKPKAAPKKAAEAKPSKPAKGKAAKGKTGGDAKKK